MSYDGGYVGFNHNGFVWQQFSAGFPKNLDTHLMLNFARTNLILLI